MRAKQRSLVDDSCQPRRHLWVQVQVGIEDAAAHTVAEEEEWQVWVDLG